MRHSRRLVLAHVSILLAVATIAVGIKAAQPPRSYVERVEPSVPIVSCFANAIPAPRSGQVIVQRHLYIACIDVAAKQPAWIAYHVSRRDWDTDIVLTRNFHTPRELRDICLEQSDYAGSGVDLGHLYGLQLVSANSYAAEVNELCAIAAQPPDVNRGPWLLAENRVKELSADGDVAVLAGQLWEKRRPKLPNADEPHKVASHWWLLISAAGESHAWLFPWNAARDAPLENFGIDPAELRRRISAEWWGGND